MAGLVRLGLSEWKPKTAIACSLAVATGVSLIDGMLQWLHPERFADFHDLALNFTGAALGVLGLEPLLRKESAQPLSGKA